MMSSANWLTAWRARSTSRMPARVAKALFDPMRVERPPARMAPDNSSRSGGNLASDIWVIVRSRGACPGCNSPWTNPCQGSPGPGSLPLRESARHERLPSGTPQKSVEGRSLLHDTPLHYQLRVEIGPLATARYESPWPQAGRTRLNCQKIVGN